MTVPDDARLRELASQCEDMAAMARLANRHDMAQVPAECAAALRAVIAARALCETWAEDSCDLAPFECADQLAAILSAPAPDAREGENDG